uniref:PDZ domain-containing protein n=1 Tax=Strigamia maritima TaxID=126957 RepID=T1IJS4_STRMM
MTVIIEKSKPSLGVVIEGGSDTQHCLPRIVNIQSDGAAFEAGGLRVGHILLKVGKLCLRGLDHKSAATLISSAYQDCRYKCLKLVVTEAKRTPKELRQKSMSFLYGE